jgi:excisionase family DNA binding protein
MGMRTGQDKSWTAKRVGSLRRVHDIHAYRSAEKGGEWLTMSEAAAELKVTNHVIRRLIQDRVIPAEQIVPGAPYQIKESDLRDDRVAAVLRRKGSPHRSESQNELPIFPNT